MKKEYRNTTNIMFKGFLSSINAAESNLTLLQLKNDLQKIHQPTYIKKAIRSFYTLGFDYDEILPQKLVFMALCVLDNLITNNSFPEIQENDEYFLQKLKALNLTPKPDKDGKTAFDYAKKQKQKQLVRLYKKSQLSESLNN